MAEVLIDHLYSPKEIMELVELKRSRFSYIANNMNIDPQEGINGGRGLRKTYNFKGLLQFAIAEQLNSQLSPRNINLWLDALNNMCPDLFDPKKQFEFAIVKQVENNKIGYGVDPPNLNDVVDNSMIFQRAIDYQAALVLNIGEIKKRLISLLVN